MIQNVLVKILLAPLSLLYGIGISLRNLLYSSEIIKSTEFNLPVIGIGNLSLGGAGKTPHVEYLIRLLQPYIKLATLSRGYKRKTRGFLVVGRKHSALDVGDEPLQYFLKYPDVKVAVSESRSIGIPQLLQSHPDIQTILLDDSYQHLSVQVGLNILLTEYDRPYFNDFLLPSGRLRETSGAAKRADIIVVSKCPDELSEQERSTFINRLKPKANQDVFFSKYVYGPLYNLANGQRAMLTDFDQVLLVTGIAHEDYLLKYIYSQVNQVYTLVFEDHHLFNAHEVSQMKLKFDHISSTNKAIITTEKDATRLILHKDYIQEQGISIWVLPLKVSFLGLDGQGFDKRIKDFLLNFKV